MTAPDSPRAVVAGASGFMGTAIVRALEADGMRVSTIGRSGALTWDDPRAIAREVDGAALVLNLAGKPVHCRYTDRNRDEILRSRTRTTRILGDAIAGSTNPARVWMNASSATIYAHTMETPHTETSGILGTGFSVDVARAWEDELYRGELPGTRRIALRTAIVLGDGPATALLFTLARTGLGGPQFDGWAPPHRRYRGIGPYPSGPEHAAHHRTHGRQKFSWIHLDDVIGAVRHLRDHEDLSGPVNLTSPYPRDNATLMRLLRRTVGMPLGIPSRRWMLEAAMWLLRTEPELVLKSRWVLPEALLASGYVFRHPDLEETLRDVRHTT